MTLTKRVAAIFQLKNGMEILFIVIKPKKLFSLTSHFVLLTSLT